MVDPKDVKKSTDRSGEIFQDALTENQSKPPGARRDDEDHQTRLDPNVENDEPAKHA